MHLIPESEFLSFFLVGWERGGVRFDLKRPRLDEEWRLKTLPRQSRQPLAVHYYCNLYLEMKSHFCRRHCTYIDKRRGLAGPARDGNSVSLHWVFLTLLQLTYVRRVGTIETHLFLIIRSRVKWGERYGRPLYRVTILRVPPLETR